MTRNTARKKAVRAEMARTGKTFAHANRTLPAGETGPDAWIVQEAQFGPDGPLPYEFVVTTDGRTFGSFDRGIIIGGVTEADERRIDVYWRDLMEAGEDPATALAGMYLVSRDRFTGRFATWRSPVRDIEPAPHASRRETLFGGVLPTDKHRWGGMSMQEFAQRQRADKRAKDERPVSIDFTFEGDHESLFGVGADGITSAGMIDGFVFEGPPRMVVTWEDAVTTVLDGENLDRLRGARLMLRTSDTEVTLSKGVLDYPTVEITDGD